ncbi:pentatricopeptide repeat-containing protein At1g43980, mitochondrial-like [Musa acuminata AAA Group]|uniref:pentatricopeptide repeat-containing protein At1g43980, mitochondrial-like n=1 Tax=Musa acuminata AAA Group TaxID=214697 RepID=UPI0031D3F6BF
MINFGGSLRTTGRFSVSFFSNLIDRCLTLGSLYSAQSIHAHLVKTGLHRHTFLGNRLLGLYSGLGSITLAIGVFHDIPDKNRFTWNILLMALVRTGCVEAAHELFEEMPDRDVVSWNSLISGYVSTGYVDKAFGVLHRMQDLGVKVSAFTLSITAACVSSPRQAKQVHGFITRFGSGSLNTVLGNSLIDMYGRVGLAGYASQIFCAMDNSDVISWNSMISAYGRSGCGMEALECFCAMRAARFSTDEFTMSSVLNICTDLENLAKD